MGQCTVRYSTEQTQIWTARVRKACEKIKESHILVVLEDQWPSLPVSTTTVQNILGLMQSQENIGIVYLDKEVHGMPLWQQNSHFYLLPPETPYRMSVVPAIWDRDFLLTAFHEDLSAWDFERVGSFEKSTYSKTVLVTVDRVFARVCETGAVMQGKWLRGVAAFAKENGLKIDFSKRETLSSKDLFLKDCKSFVLQPQSRSDRQDPELAVPSQPEEITRRCMPGGTPWQNCQASFPS